jgi:hypothetical protein
MLIAHCLVHSLPIVFLLAPPCYRHLRENLPLFLHAKQTKPAVRVFPCHPQPYTVPGSLCELPYLQCEEFCLRDSNTGSWGNVKVVAPEFLKKVADA